MNTVQHFAFNCLDRRAQEAFYSDHFGFRRARVFNRDQPNEFVMLRLGATCLELFNAAPGTTPDSRGGEQTVGFKHMAFETPDMEAAIARFNATGIETGRIIHVDSVPGLRICFLKDPEGNIVELMQGWRDEA
jgi:glyoxylase I family protein